MGRQTASGSKLACEPAVEKLAGAMSNAQKVVVATGAGVSAESGIPTFRDKQSGLWAKYRPEDLATPEAFRRQPSTVWDWYQWRRTRLASVNPNPGHYALAKLEGLLPALTLITQNVDGLHAAAGSNRIIELHGNIRRNRCSREGIVSNWNPVETASPPACTRCGANLRPDVVWFGEGLDPAVLDAAFNASAQCDVFISVGTSAVVEPAASLARIAMGNGAMVAEINPQKTPLTNDAAIFIAGKSGEVLPRVLQLLLVNLG